MTGSWLPLATNAGALADSVNAVWVLTVSFLIFFMQPGFVLLEAGQVRSKNVANIATKNLFDWSLGVLLFFLVGLGLAKLVGGFTSPGDVSFAESFAYVNSPGEWIDWLFGAVFAMTAATIVSGAVAERVKFKSYVAYSVALTGVIYPLVVGLTWQGGLLSGGGYLGQLLGTGYLDFAGGTVVHMVGGLAGLVTAYILGPRRGRFDDDGHSNPIPGHSVLFAVVGTLFLAFGWYGFNVGTQATVLSEDGAFLGAELGRVALTTTLAMGGGGVASSLVTTYYQGKPDPLFTANGLLGGLVAVTSAAAYVTWWGGLLLGVIGGALVYPTYKWTVERLGIDDVCGVFAVHGAAGGVGATLIPLFGVGTAGGWVFLGVDQLAMQVLGVTIIGTWTILATVTVFGAIDLFVGVRVGEESESAGLDQNEHNIVAYPQFVTDGGAVAETSASSQGTQESDQATMWRGEQVETGNAGILAGGGIESFPDPTFVVDGTNEITAINSRAVRFFGTVEADAVGSTPDTLATRSDGTLDATADALDGDEEVRERAGQVTVSGETIPVCVTATPLRDDGVLVGALATVRNNAAEVASERHRQTVEEYRDEGLETQREKLADLADGRLDLEPGVPDPPEEAPELTALHGLFEEMDQYVVETAANVCAIVEKLPDQSAELAETGESLSESSQEVLTAVTEIDDLSSEIETEVGRLATRTEDTSSTVSELSASIEEISASTAEIETQSSEAVDLTREGVAEMTDAVSQIRDATEHSAAVAAELDSLEEKMDDVAEIVDIIRDIAEQTNMLALNASIEAANADASGDGFAVVADEVKALAAQSRESATDIANIVADTKDQTDQVVGTIREANAEIDAGTDAVEGAVETLEQIRRRTEETNDGVAEISTAVASQADNAEMVSTTIQEIVETTDDIDALADRISGLTDEQTETIDEVAGITDRLSALATDVHGHIDTFELEADLRTRSAIADGG